MNRGHHVKPKNQLTMINLKETKRIKEALLSEPERFEQIIEDTDLAICITNDKARFVAVNQNYLKLYGYQKEELIGHDFTVVVPKEHREALRKYHAQFFIEKYEILRKWEVMNKKGELMEIFADAGYHPDLMGSACKITLIQFQRIINKKDSGYNVASV
ncbi:MAG: PAS domain S-box protein [Cyclobacteriaceae bacterium]